MRQAALRQLVDTFMTDYGEMAVERLDGEEASYERMVGCAQSLPFLVPRKLVILREPSVCKEFVEKFEKFLESIAETNDIVIVEPKLDKRLNYYKQLRKATDFREFAVLDAAGLIRSLAAYAKEQGGTLNTSDARTLIDRVGSDQLTLQHELDKLLAYNLKIDTAAIELLTERTPQSSIFELLDAAFAGNAKRAIALYDEQRAQHVEPQQVVAMLVWQLHVLAIVKAAGDSSADTVAREAKLSPFTVRKAQGLAQRMSITQLKNLVSSLREFDVRLKSEALDVNEAVQYYLLSLAL